MNTEAPKETDLQLRYIRDHLIMNHTLLASTHQAVVGSDPEFARLLKKMDDATEELRSYVLDTLAKRKNRFYIEQAERQQWPSK